MQNKSVLSLYCRTMC